MFPTHFLFKWKTFNFWDGIHTNFSFFHCSLENQMKEAKNFIKFPFSCVFFLQLYIVPNCLTSVPIVLPLPIVSCLKQSLNVPSYLFRSCILSSYLCNATYFLTSCMKCMSQHQLNKYHQFHSTLKLWHQSIMLWFTLVISLYSNSK